MNLRIVYGRHPDPHMAEWEECPQSEATIFCVGASDDAEELDHFMSKAEAEAFIAGFRTGELRLKDRIGRL
jgi:hypothetical protein